jgi:Ca-activated chloride channel family protein
MHGRIGVAEMTIKPILPLWVLLPVFALLFAAAAFFIFKNRSRIADKIFTFVRMFLILALALVIGIRPCLVETKYEFATKNLDVLFVIDTTISMWARDYNGSRERMNGVAKDVNLIIDELAGSNFGLVTFDDSAHVLAPFTQDMQYIRDLVDTFKTPDSYYAQGSDLSIPMKDIESLLISSSKKENRKTIVFYISDGEITNGKELVDYSPLGQYIDNGAVMGYGTEDGGKMKDGYETIKDPETGKDGISKIDEDNLNQIAEDLGLQYMNMNSGNDSIKGAIEVIKESSKTIIENGQGAEIQRDIYFYFAVPLAILLFVEIWLIVRRGRL